MERELTVTDKNNSTEINAKFQNRLNFMKR